MASRNRRGNEEIRRRNKDAAQRHALFWVELANRRQSEVVRQLLGLSAVLLPLSASVVVANIELEKIEKILLFSSWVFFFISIVTGFIQIQLDAWYFVMLSRDSSKREALWSDSGRPISEIEKDVKALGKVPEMSTSLPLRLQALAFFIGLICVASVGGFILFRSARCKRHLDHPFRFYRSVGDVKLTHPFSGNHCFGKL